MNHITIYIIMFFYIIGIFIENTLIILICNLGSKERYRYLKYVFIICLSVYSFVYPEANIEYYWYCVIGIPLVLLYSLINLEAQYYKKIFYSCVGYLLSGLTHISLFLLLNLIPSKMFQLNSYEDPLGFLIEKILAIVVLYIFYKLIKKHIRNDEYVSTKSWIILLLITISAVDCSVFLKRGIKFDGLTPFVTYMNIFFLWVLTLSSIYLYFDLIYREYLDMENQILDMQLKNQEAYKEELILMNKETRRLKHDLNNHIVILKDYYHSDKVENYANELLDTINIGNIPMMDNDLLMYLLHSKIIWCRERNIKFEVHIFDDFSFMSEIDLVTLFSNLLDNAIEAQKLQNGTEKIVVTTKVSKYGYVLEVKNTITTSILRNNKLLQTTKEDRRLHGQGIRIIKNVVDSYYGSVEFTEDNGYFVVTCTMSDKKKGRLNHNND